MNRENTIVMLMKQYIDQVEEFDRANKLVVEHKKIQEKLKCLFEEEGIEQYVLNDEGYMAVLSFKRGTMKRVDVAVLPQEIKDLYLKETITKREILNVISKP